MLITDAPSHACTGASQQPTAAGHVSKFGSEPRPAYARTSKGNAFGISMATAMIISMQCILHWNSTGTSHGNAHGSANLNSHGDSHGNSHIGIAMGISMKVPMGIPMRLAPFPTCSTTPIPATITPTIPVRNHYVRRHLSLLFA